MNEVLRKFTDWWRGPDDLWSVVVAAVVVVFLLYLLGLRS
jgi:hypothetical protein